MTSKELRTPPAAIQLGIFDVRRYQGSVALAVAAARDNGGGVVRIPGRGATRPITATIPCYDNVTIAGDGSGASILEVPAGANFPVFDIDGAARVRIRGVTIRKASGDAAIGTAYGVYVRGAGADLALDDVLIEGLVRGVCVAGQDGTTPGRAARVACRGVTCNDSTSSGFGFCFDDVDDVELVGCYARNNGLDGVKLRRNVTKFRAIGGAFTGNGVGAAVADGLDAYAGGQQISILGGDYSGNTANGITIKTDTLNETDAATYGVPRDISVQGVTAEGNTGSGVGVYSFDSPSFATTGTPWLAHSAISGCVCTGNGYYGIIAGGRAQSVTGNICRGNGYHGIYVTERASRVDLAHNHISGNSLGNPGHPEKTGHGIYVAAGADRITITGGSICGVDDRDAKTEADLAALTKYHKGSIYVHASATNVLIRDVREGYTVDARGIQTWGTTAGSNQLVHYIPQGGTPATYAGSTFPHGGPGSTWTQYDASAGRVLWVKATGTPDTPNTGWVPAHVGPTGAAAVDPGNVAAGGSLLLSLSLTGVQAGDVASVMPPSNLATSGLYWFVQSCTTNQVNVRLVNPTGSDIDVGSGTWYLAAVKAQ